MIWLSVKPTGSVNLLTMALVGCGLPWTESYGRALKLEEDRGAIAVVRIGSIKCDQRRFVLLGNRGSRVDGKWEPESSRVFILLSRSRIRGQARGPVSLNGDTEPEENGIINRHGTTEQQYAGERNYRDVGKTSINVLFLWSPGLVEFRSVPASVKGWSSLEVYIDIDPSPKTRALRSTSFVCSFILGHLNMDSLTGLGLMTIP